MVNTRSGNSNENDIENNSVWISEHLKIASLPPVYSSTTSPRLNFDGDSSANWKLWKQQVTSFVKSNGLEEAEDPKKCAFWNQLIRNFFYKKREMLYWDITGYVLLSW